MRPLGVYVGTLPSARGAAGAFPSLLSLHMHGAPLSGTLPVSWAGNNSFAVLSELTHTTSTGTPPSSWGSPGAFSALSWLELGQNSLSGSLSEAWSSEAAFPKLSFLTSSIVVSQVLSPRAHSMLYHLKRTLHAFLCDT